MKREYPVLKTNILYLCLGCMLYFGGAYFQSKEIYSGLLITEYILILIPNIIYILVKGLDLKKYFKFNRISFKQIIYIVLIMLLAYPVAVILNSMAMLIISIFTNYVPESVPLPANFKMYLFSLFVIAISPGICEEIMFRGTIMRGYKGEGRKKSIILSSVLFGVFHFNIQNLIGPIFLGIILGILVYKSNSIYSSILGHSLNNGIAMTIGYSLNKSNQMTSGNTDIIGGMNILPIIIFFICFFVVSFILMIALIKNFPEREIEDRVELASTREKTEAWEYLPLLLIFILFIWVNARVYFNLF